MITKEQFKRNLERIKRLKNEKEFFEQYKQELAWRPRSHNIVDAICALYGETK